MVPNQPSTERVVFHFASSWGGVETWIRDFLFFGGGTYSIASSSPGFSHDMPLARRRKPGNLRTVVQFVRIARRQIGVHTRRSQTGFLVFNIQSAALLLLLIPGARFIYFSCNDFGKQMPLMSTLRRISFPNLEKYLLKRAEFVFSMSRPDSQRIARVRSDVEVIGSIYNDRVFTHASSAQKAFRGVLWIGRLVDLKDPHLAISAFEASAESHGEVLAMVGEGPLESEIRARIDRSRYKNRISVLPWLEALELAHRIRGARIVIITSKSEAAPRTVLECLASGTPVVATAESDPENWIVRTGGGSVSEDREVDSLAGLIRENLVLRPRIDFESLASAKASEAMPKLEERISRILASTLNRGK